MQADLGGVHSASTGSRRTPNGPIDAATTRPRAEERDAHVIGIASQRASTRPEGQLARAAAATSNMKAQCARRRRSGSRSPLDLNSGGPPGRAAAAAVSPARSPPGKTRSARSLNIVSTVRFSFSKPFKDWAISGQLALDLEVDHRSQPD